MADENEITVNQRLLTEALKLKEERRVARERLAKIESNQSGVSKSVYEKVHADYVNRLKQVSDQMLEKKQGIDRELATLYESRDKIQANLKNHREILEEVEFRHKLGEFSSDEYQSKAKEERDKVARFEKVLGGVENGIQRYEGIFTGEGELLGSAEAPPSFEETPDEWEQEAAAAATPSSANPKEAVEESTKPNLQMQPKITVVSGHDHVGKNFSINGALTIGRSQSNQLVLKDAKVSRQHAEIRPRGSECILIDLNSSNGTLVNGNKIHEHLLSPNDEIQIGDYLLQFQC